jgi:hypothetical protein
MSGAERIIQECRVRKRRFDAAVSAVELLSTEQRKDLIAVLVDRVESETRAPSVNGPSVTPPSELVRRRPAPTNGKTQRRNKTDIAEALVRERPGISSAEVGVLIDQNRAAADCTLRSIVKRRGTIQRRDGGWHPVTTGGSPVAN